MRLAYKIKQRKQKKRFMKAFEGCSPNKTSKKKKGTWPNTNK